MEVQPYKFEPIYKEKIWGGRSLERLFGRRLPPGVKIGESWELADLEAGESVVADGPESGKTLGTLAKEKGRDLLGPVRLLENGRFPLLLKFLDANDILSLQVHPDERAARELGPPAAVKTECWYVLESRDGYILKGVKAGVTAEQFRRALGDDRAVAELVERVEVRAGEFHYLPAGTVHALGPGVVVAEIQTPSDTTYRVSDWGRGREIHVEQALRCIRFQPLPPSPPGAGGETLVKTPYFRVRRLHMPKGQTALAGGRCAAWMVLAGSGRVGTGGAEDTPVGAGDTLLLPAALARPVVEAREEMTVLEVTFP